MKMRMKDERYPRHAPRRRICYAMPCPAMPCNATINNTKDKEVKFIKDTLMQKAYELSLWKIRDGDDAQSAISTRYHSQVREREGEETEREGGKKEIYFQSKSKSKSYSKSKSKNRIHQAREKNAFKCRYPE